MIQNLQPIVINNNKIWEIVNYQMISKIQNQGYRVDKDAYLVLNDKIN